VRKELAKLHSTCSFANAVSGVHIYCRTNTCSNPKRDRQRRKSRGQLAPPVESSGVGQVQQLEDLNRSAELWSFLCFVAVPLQNL
jgi:hypothetical protein